ncbi:OmpA family protein [Flavobacterium turcicum]|uniref:OmpA family protein n=1 Tax=Flavobacterium turcicum TaxID=2764718 RepID=A0ABR7JHV6_9FLAO|nr:OmpA family protein [Flavobacterium turcicum]MBC5864081.1 OmpA family protein [Flavobacterium turcicum]NHL02847.1 OmpA family protein [Flavobacterium turcicum]
MKQNILFCITLLITISISGYSQKSQVKLANKEYENYAFIDAIKTYEKVAEKGYKSAEMFKKLGNSYYFNAQLDQAAKWYQALFEMNTSDLETEYYYRYAQSLRAIGQNDKADRILLEFTKKSGGDSRGILYKKNTNYLEQIKKNSGRYTIEDAGINSVYSDYGTTIYNDKIIFTSARDTGGISQRKHKWTNQHFTNLYSASLDQSSATSKPTKFDENVNSKFNESTPVFTKDLNTMYFTRNNFLDGKKGKNTEKVTLLKIYKAIKVNNTWTNIIALPFTSDNYNTAHPALSPDEKTLYFASDMPGTIGQSDLFKVAINADGSFSNPENLGKSINTEGRETFPFISEDNELYFSSDGHPGLGGLDIFVSTLTSDSTWGTVENVGSDINSPKDDFAYYLDTTSRKGFFTSNKDGGKGYDDIYKFLELKKIKCEHVLYGVVTDLSTSTGLANATIVLLDEQYNTLKTQQADAQGKYSFNVECDKIYFVRAQYPEFTTKEVKAETKKENEKTYVPIALESSKCKVAIGDDLGKCFNIKMIYFDLDKSTIKQAAAFDLEKILDVLQQNPTMKLDIRSHTDSRQTFKYNEALSDRRAKATIDWLISKGINANRLTGKGYGETQLVNKCADGVTCTEEEHQLNRRSEFIVTAL